MSKEFFVRAEDNTKRVIYLCKEFLKESNELTVMSSHIGADVCSRVVNALVDLKYCTVGDIQTQTNIVNGVRKVRLVIKLNKGSEFDKVYAESLKIREEMLAKRNLGKNEEKK